MNQQTEKDSSDTYVESLFGPSDDAPVSLPGWSMQGIVWGSMLVVVSIVGNVIVPWVIADTPLYLGGRYESILAVLFGLLIAQPMSIILVLNAYLASLSSRLLVGCYIHLLVCISWFVGLMIAGNSKPSIPNLVSLLGGLAIAYLFVAWVLGTLLKNPRSGWIEPQCKSHSQYSLRALLSAMSAVAILSLLVKCITNQTSSDGFNSMWELTSYLLLAFLEINIACLVYLQYKALLGSISISSWAWFLTFLVLSPLIFTAIVDWWHGVELLSIEMLLCAYGLYMGIVVGVAMVIPLLPRSH